MKNEKPICDCCKEPTKYYLQMMYTRENVDYHHRDNPASGRVMQKCGMTFIKAEYRRTDSERLSGEYHYYEIENNSDELEG